MKLIRLLAHPAESEVVVLDVPPGLNQAIGYFEPARWVDHLRAYVIHQDVVPAVYRWAHHVEAHVIDERRQRSGKDAPRIHPPECRHCAQPGRISDPPRYCPGCGDAWEPLAVAETAQAIARTTCKSCGRQQPGRFKHCAGCGQTMVYPTPTPRPRQDRKRLTDPMQLGEVLGDIGANLPGGCND